MPHNSETLPSLALPLSSSPSQINLPSYCITRADDLTLIFDPPVKSQELADALSYHYPLHKGLQQKLQQASLDFFRFGKGGASGVSSSSDISAPNSSSSAPLSAALRDAPIHSLAAASDSKITQSTVPAQQLQPLRPRSNSSAIIDTAIYKPNYSSTQKNRGRRPKGKGLEPKERERIGKNRGNTCARHRRSRTTCHQNSCPDNRLNACDYHRQSVIPCLSACPGNLLSNKEPTKGQGLLAQRESPSQANQSPFRWIDFEAAPREILQPPSSQLQQDLPAEESHIFEPVQILEQSELASSSQSFIAQAIEFGGPDLSFWSYLTPTENYLPNYGGLDFSSASGIEQYGSYLDSSVDIWSHPALDADLLDATPFPRSQSRELERSLDRLQPPIDPSAARVEVGRTGPDRFQLPSAESGFDTSQHCPHTKLSFYDGVLLIGLLFTMAIPKQWESHYYVIFTACIRKLAQIRQIM